MKAIKINHRPRHKGQTLDKWQKAHNNQQLTACFALFFYHFFIQPVE